MTECGRFSFWFGQLKYIESFRMGGKKLWLPRLTPKKVTFRRISTFEQSRFMSQIGLLTSLEQKREAFCFCPSLETEKETPIDIIYRQDGGFLNFFPCCIITESVTNTAYERLFTWERSIEIRSISCMLLTVRFVDLYSICFPSSLWYIIKFNIGIKWGIAVGPRFYCFLQERNVGIGGKQSLNGFFCDGCRQASYIVSI